jgi:shikimate dehydrogenase
MKIHPSETPATLSENSEQTLKKQVLTDSPPQKPVEIGGPKGLEPTRYGDWEKAGRCSDF